MNPERGPFAVCARGHLSPSAFSPSSVALRALCAL